MSRHRLLQPAPIALLSLVAVVALLFADLLSLARFREARAYADRTSDVSIALQKTLTAMVDAETASRGFLLTRDAAYQESFEQAERALSQAFAALRGLTSDSPLQLRRVAELERLSTAESAFMKETVRLVTSGRTGAAIAAVREGAGKRLMDQVRRVASDMAADEDGLLRSRVASAQNGYRLSMALLVVAGIAVLGLAAMLFAIDRDIQKRSSLERSLQGAVHAREQMLAIVSHDLRNPLSVVMMAAKLIERCASPDPSGKRLKKHANAISTIDARVVRSKGDIVFSISDTGTGIPQAQIPHLFDPYWQASASGSGAGLGLSIVKAIVGAHRGRVWVETEEGTGSSFYCALPAAARGEVQQVPLGAARDRTHDIEQARGMKTILVVDDEYALVEGLTEFKARISGERRQ